MTNHLSSRAARLRSRLLACLAAGLATSGCASTAAAPEPPPAQAATEAEAPRPQRSDPQAVADLVAKVVAAYGGPEAVRRQQAFRMEGEVHAHSRGLTGAFRRDFVSPDKLRVDIRYPSSHELRIVTPAGAYRGAPGNLVKVKGPMQLVMVYQMLRMVPPLAMSAHPRGLREVTGRIVGAVPLRVLQLAMPNLAVDFWIDTRTHHVVRTVGTIQAGMGRIAFETRYRDFQTVDGVLVPMSEENFASGNHVSTTKVTSVKFGAEGLGPFDPPPSQHPGPIVQARR